jgi:hypothetical protein
LAKDYPHPRRPWFFYFRNNGHTTEDCPELIVKWGDLVRQRGDNIISSELKKKELRVIYLSLTLLLVEEQKLGKMQTISPRFRNLFPKMTSMTL